MKKENWSTSHINDLSGKVIIVTGGNSGLGYESVKAFAEKGAEVILCSRSMEQGQTAKAAIEQGNSSGKIVVMTLDLMDLASIKRFTAQFKAAYNRLDVLLNNAGIMTTPFFLTKDGFEAQMGTNHLGHFALTGGLIDLLKATPKSRIITVSSSAHRQGKMDFDNLLFDNSLGYTPMKAYGRSKLSNLLFAYELQRQLEMHGIDSLSAAAHPGVSQTNLGRHLEGKLWFKILGPLIAKLIQEQAQGALPQIRASVDQDVRGGQYFGPHRGMSGFPVLVASNKASYNQEDARKLWKVSEKLTGISFNFN